MSKQDYLAAIKEKISCLPQSDIEKSLDYYGEMIDDYLEDGLTLEQALDTIGDPGDIASQILMETSLVKLVKAKTRSSRTLRAWEIILLVLGSPIWVSLLLAAAAVFLSIYIVIWSIVLAMYCVDFAIALSGIAGIIGGIALLSLGNFGQGLFLFGIGLMSVGTAILLFIAFNKATLGMGRLSRNIAIKVKSLFIRKGDVK